MRPVIYCVNGTERTKHIAAAMRDGFLRHGLSVEIRTRFDLVPVGDVAIAYGWSHEPVFKVYPNYAYFDLGYWDRRPQFNKKDGYHRLAVNSWDTEDSMFVGMPGDRLPEIHLGRWGSKSGPVLVTGMSDKAARTHGFRPGQWEAEMIEHLRKITRREIILRRKSNTNRDTIEAVLSRAAFLVTHHSNTAIDALIAGVPYWCRKGVGVRYSVPEISEEYISNPPLVCTAERMQLLQDISYAQWRPSEMRTGEVWEWILRSL